MQHILCFRHVQCTSMYMHNMHACMHTHAHAIHMYVHTDTHRDTVVTDLVFLIILLVYISSLVLQVLTSR